ncbi:MAG: NCS2 family permease [Corynebacterium kroppenstedtii]|nr:NCS2 family permease [Corynebacterium kroppenstedtii]
MPSNTASARFDQWFHLTERGSTTSREVRGGIVTFFTMAYILALNPLIIGTAADKNGKLLNGAPKFLDAAGTSLNTAGIDDNKIMVMAVTAFVAAIMTIAMGVWGRFPMGIATGLGINSLLAYVVAPTMTWSQAMGLVVWEGIFILVFVLTGVREMIFRAVPNSLRSAISVGIGLFIAFVGFVDSGVIRPGSGTPVTLGVGGSLEGWPILLCLFGFLLLVVLHQRHIKGSMLIAIIGTSLVGVAIEAVGNIGAQSDKNPTGWALNVPRLPGASDFRWPDLGLLGHVDLFGGFLANGHFRIGVFLGTLLVVFSLMLADFFDTMGTVVAIGDHAGLLGARTGIASIVTGLGFLLAMFLSPIVSIIPSEAAAPVLVFVGFLMMAQVTRIDWKHVEEGLPAFLGMVLMPFAYSITTGIGAGLIMFCITKVIAGKARSVHPLLWVVALLFVVYFSQTLLMKLFGQL